MRNIYIGPSLAPYRLDLCNHLYTDYNFDIYHLFEEGASGTSSDLLFKRAVFPRRFLFGTKTPGLKGFRQLWRLMRDNRPEMVFSIEFSLITIYAVLIKHLLGLKSRIVAMCDDSIDMISGNDFTLAHRIARKIVPPLVDEVFSSDKEACGWYRDHFGKGVYFPIIEDEDDFRSRLKESLPVSCDNARKYDLGGKKTILYVGRLISLKRVEDLIRAYALVKAPDNALVIVGDGDQMQMLRNLDSELGTDAIFTGFLEGSDLLSWYNIADVQVLPSILEAFGAVVNEALLSGCPSVLSRQCGAVTIVDPGVTGEIFNAGDINALAEKLRLVLDRVPFKDGLRVRESLMGIRFSDGLDDAISAIMTGKR